jgi:hypothetical protein
MKIIFRFLNSLIYYLWNKTYQESGILLPSGILILKKKKNATRALGNVRPVNFLE